MATKEEYQAKMEGQLKEVTGKIAELIAKADKASSDAKGQYESQIKTLKGKFQETQGRLQQLKSSSGDAWVTLKDGTEKAWGELRGAVDSALGKFRTKDEN